MSHPTLSRALDQLGLGLVWSLGIVLGLGGVVPMAAAQEQPGGDPVSAEAIYQDPSLLSQAELVSERRSMVPGERIQIGLSIRVPDGWHTYWVNPGDAGAEAVVHWEVVPEGFRVSEILWPRPERYEVPPLMSYGYGDEVLLPMDLEVPDDALPGSRVTLAGVAEWLFCDEICLFTDTEVSLELDVVGADPASDPEWADRFVEVRALLPSEPTGWEMYALHGADRFVLGVEPPEGWQGALDELYFFPLDPSLLEHATPQPVVAEGEGAGVRLILEPGRYLAEVPERLDGVVAPPPGTAGWEAGQGPVAIEVSVPLETAPADRIAALLPTEPFTAAEDGSAGGIPTLVVALVLAFLGGLLLNLMPCVFPVISLKILSFVNQAGSEPRRVRRHGYAFGVGVILSFLALAGLLLAIRAAGADVGWGFQLQDPRIVAALTVLLFLIGLNLLGVFEIGTSLTRLGSVGSGDGYRDSFLTGVLATIVATPCTAPLMGVAIGAAFIRPPVESLAIFGGLGLGMATPYMILSSAPGLLERLPSPGRWMETFRELMAFPMFAVALWLLWVFGLQTGVDGAAALLAGLLLLALGVWVLGRWSSERPGGRPVWAVPAAGLVLLAALGAMVHGASMEPPASAGTTASAGADGVVWEEYSAEAVERYQGEGRAVFVDFTAAWCLSCQVNKRTVLSSNRIETAFGEADVALLRADWTRRDARIADALQSLGRSGVPVYALYPPEPGARPELLPEILTHGTVLRALERLPATTALR